MKQPDAARVKRFVPFSEGRRDCVGQHLARMNYTSTLARLLGNFHFELAPEVSPRSAIVLRMPMRRCRPRKRCIDVQHVLCDTSRRAH